MGVEGRTFVGAETKVHCGGRVRMGVGARKFVGAGAGVRCVGGIGAEECGERCAAVGRFLSRNKGKVGGMGASL